MHLLTTTLAFKKCAFLPHGSFEQHEQEVASRKWIYSSFRAVHGGFISYCLFNGSIAVLVRSIGPISCHHLDACLDASLAHLISYFLSSLAQEHPFGAFSPLTWWFEHRIALQLVGYAWSRDQVGETP